METFNEQETLCNQNLKILRKFQCKLEFLVPYKNTEFLFHKRTELDWKGKTQTSQNGTYLNEA